MIKLIFDASYDNMNDEMEKQVQHQIKDTTCNQDSFEGGGQTLCLDLADEKVAAVALYWRIITNVRADVKVIKEWFLSYHGHRACVLSAGDVCTPWNQWSAQPVPSACGSSLAPKHLPFYSEMSTVYCSVLFVSERYTEWLGQHMRSIRMGIDGGP